MTFQSYWTKDREDELRRLWDSDLSQQEIADMLGDGATWKAIGNKAKRMGLPRRKPKRKPYTPPPRKSHASVSALTELFIGGKGEAGKAKPLPESMEAAQGGGKPWLSYRYKRDCAWPLWAAGEKNPHRMMVCGEPVSEGVYCAHHVEVADGRGKVRPPEAMFRGSFQHVVGVRE